MIAEPLDSVIVDANFLRMKGSRKFVTGVCIKICRMYFKNIDK